VERAGKLPNARALLLPLIVDGVGRTGACQTQVDGQAARAPQRVKDGGKPVQIGVPFRHVSNYLQLQVLVKPGCP